jgi:hypothetical protein
MKLNLAARWLTCSLLSSAVLALPVWAQSQSRTPVAPKSKAAAASPIRPAPSRVVSADVTAQLQAAAAAAAAAYAASLAAPAHAAPATGDAPALAAPTTSNTASNAAAADVLPSVTASERTSAAPVPEQAVVPSVSPELWIAQQIHQGHLPCELGASVRVEADVRQPGFFHVHGKGFRYRMFPVQTSTGALRLEDKKAGAVWLQLANKSMLMDQKKGRRLADECAHPDQLAYAEAMKTNPPPSLFDTKGMGR